MSHYSPTRRGDPDDPLSDDEVTDKLVDLATPVIGAEAATALARTLWALDGDAVMSGLFGGYGKAA